MYLPCSQVFHWQRTRGCWAGCFKHGWQSCWTNHRDSVAPSPCGYPCHSCHLVRSLFILLLFLKCDLVLPYPRFCKHTRRTGSYNKEKLEEEMAESPNDSPRQGTFCNPTYDDCAMGTSEDKMVLTGAEVLCNDPDISTSDAGMGAVVVYENPVKDGGMYSGASAPPA